MAHGAMVGRCEQEADAGLGQRALDGIARAIQLHAQLGEHVGGARLRGGGTIAVLGDDGAGSGGHDGGRGGDIIRALAITAGTAGIDRALGRSDRRHAAAQDPCPGGNILGPLAQRGEPHQKAADRRIGRIAFHQLVKSAGDVCSLGPLALAEGLQA